MHGMYEILELMWAVGILGLVWWLSGVVSFVYWWTREYDITIADLVMALLVGGCLGPIAWIVGWSIHGGDSRVIMRKKRKSND